MRGVLVVLGLMAVLFIGGGGYLVVSQLQPATTIKGVVTARSRANPYSDRNARCRFTVGKETFTAGIQVCDETAMSNHITASVRSGEAQSMSDDRGHTWSVPAMRYVYIGLGAFMMLGGLVMAGAFYKKVRR